MTLYTATITLILVMDPLGNIPIFLSVLNSVEEAKHRQIILRESLIAFFALTIFLFAGQPLMHGLGITDAALSIAGGIILFLIALGMIFPSVGLPKDRQVIEPFIVPLAIPLIAGPSAIATVLLFGTQQPEKSFEWFIALAIASAIVTIILFFSHHLRKLLGQKGLVALERLMGMLLTTVAVQMFLSGISIFLHSSVKV